VLLAMLGLVAAGLVWRASGVLLVAFLGVLGGTLLAWPAELIADRTPIPRKPAVLIVAGVLAALAGLAVWWSGELLAEQTTRLAHRLPQVLDEARGWLEGREWGRKMLDSMPKTGEALRSNGGLAKATAYVGGVIGGLTDVLVILAVALFTALAPATYINASAHLLPNSKRPYFKQTVSEAGEALRRWLLGRLAAMAIIGVGSTIGLMVIGIELAVPLGLFAALCAFIPFLGPLISGVPAIGIALLSGPQDALLVLGLWVALEAAESNLITPLIQEQMLELPPAALIVAQILMGVIAGPIGIIAATPLLVVTVVLAQRLYIRPVLDDDTGTIGQPPDDTQAD